ncbi:MAG: hypothetical protein U9N07_06400, partial [Euryarchaeota archaeon]|nr:hypothetical protein [Euryarchaeota archaeon]
MIGENIRIVDWGIEQWNNFYHAIFHRGKVKTAIIAIHNEGVPLKIIQTGQGSRPDLKERFRESHRIKDVIKAIYNEEDVDIVYAVSYPAIRRIFARFQSTVDFDANYIKQLFSLKDAVSCEIGYGICQYPAGSHWLANLEYKTIKKIFAAAPDNTLIMLTIFSGQKVWTNWIIGIEGGTINLITTLDAMKPRIKPMTDWRYEYYHITDRVKKQFGVKPLAFFMDRETFRDLIASREKLRYFKDALSGRKIVSKALP